MTRWNDVGAPTPWTARRRAGNKEVNGIEGLRIGKKRVTFKDADGRFHWRPIIGWMTYRDPRGRRHRTPKFCITLDLEASAQFERDYTRFLCRKSKEPPALAPRRKDRPRAMAQSR